MNRSSTPCGSCGDSSAARAAETCLVRALANVGHGGIAEEERALGMVAAADRGRDVLTMCSHVVGTSAAVPGVATVLLAQAISTAALYVM